MRTFYTGFFFFRVEANLKLQTASRLFIILCYSFLVLAVWYYWSYAQKILELQLEVKLLIVLTAIHSNQVHPKCNCRRHRIWTPFLCLLHCFFLLATSNNSIWLAPSPHTLALVRKTKVWFYFIFCTCVLVANQPERSYEFSVAIISIKTYLLCLLPLGFFFWFWN